VAPTLVWDNGKAQKESWLQSSVALVPTWAVDAKESGGPVDTHLEPLGPKVLVHVGHDKDDIDPEDACPGVLSPSSLLHTAGIHVGRASSSY
jgi:hypothetical protein